MKTLSEADYLLIMTITNPMTMVIIHTNPSAEGKAGRWKRKTTGLRMPAEKLAFMILL